MQTKTESGPSPYFSVFIPQFTQSTHARDLLLLSFNLTINVINNGGNASRPSQPSRHHRRRTPLTPVRRWSLEIVRSGELPQYDRYVLVKLRDEKVPGDRSAQTVTAGKVSRRKTHPRRSILPRGSRCFGVVVAALLLVQQEYVPMKAGCGPREYGHVLKQDFTLLDVFAWNVADQPVGKLSVEGFRPTWGIGVNHHQSVEYNRIGVPFDLGWITHFGWSQLLPRLDQQFRTVANLSEHQRCLVDKHRNNVVLGEHLMDVGLHCEPKQKATTLPTLYTSLQPAYRVLHVRITTLDCRPAMHVPCDKR